MVRKKIGLLGIEGCFGNLVGIERFFETCLQSIRNNKFPSLNSPIPTIPKGSYMHVFFSHLYARALSGMGIGESNIQPTHNQQTLDSQSSNRKNHRRSRERPPAALRTSRRAPKRYHTITRTREKVKHETQKKPMERIPVSHTLNLFEEWGVRTEACQPGVP